MTTLYLDIETIPSQLDWVKEQIAQSIKPPATISKAETIEAWWRDKSKNAIDDEYRKTSFDGTYGQIACIGYAFDDEPVQTVGTHLQMTEHTILADFAADINSRKITKIVGHNVFDFDLEFIKKRSIIKGVKIELPFLASKYDSIFFDTMTKWSTQKRISMDKLARVLGIEGKGDVDGSMVWDMYQRGEDKAIADYCADDVRMVREIYKRMIG